MSRARQRQEQRSNQQVADIGGSIQVIPDRRLPGLLPRTMCADYTKVKTAKIPTVSAKTTFSGNDNIQFAIGAENMTLEDLQTSRIEFSLDLAKTDGTTLLSALAPADYAKSNALYSKFSTADGLTESDGKVCDYVYTRNTACLFNAVELRDWSSGELLDLVENPGELMTIMEKGQSNQFWGDEGLELSDKYLATVHTFASDVGIGRAGMTEPNTISPSHIIPAFENAHDVAPVTIVPAIFRNSYSIPHSRRITNRAESSSNCNSKYRFNR